MATTTGEKRRISTGKKGRRYENDPRRALRGILSLSQSGRLLKKMRAMGKKMKRGKAIGQKALVKKGKGKPKEVSR